MILRSEDEKARPCGSSQGRRGAAVAMLLVAAGGLLATWGCDDGPPRIRIRVDTNARIPDEIDEVRVWLAASRGPNMSPELCVPWKRNIDLRTSPAVPIIVDFLPGREFDVFALVRAEFYREGSLVGLRDDSPAVPKSGTVEVLLNLDKACLDPDPSRRCVNLSTAPPVRECEGEGNCVPECILFNDADALVVPDAPSCQTLDETDGG